MANQIAELQPKINRLGLVSLAVILVGDNPVSSRYVARKESFGRKYGMEVKIFLMIRL